MNGIEHTYLSGVKVRIIQKPVYYDSESKLPIEKENKVIPTQKEKVKKFCKTMHLNKLIVRG